MSLTERLFERFNASDAVGLGHILSANAKHSAPGSEFGAELIGRDTLICYFRDTVFPKFSSIEFVPTYIWDQAAANVEIVEWRGNFVTTAGVAFKSKGVFVLEHDGSQILCMREYFDTEKTRKAFEAGSK